MDSPELIQIFMSAGLSVDLESQEESGFIYRNWQSKTALGIACEEGSVRSVSYLLAMGANPDAANSNTETPLFLCNSERDGAECIDLLLDAGAEVDYVNRFDRTAFDTYFYQCDFPLALRLLNAGADPYRKPKTNDGILCRLAWSLEIHGEPSIGVDILVYDAVETLLRGNVDMERLLLCEEPFLSEYMYGERIARSALAAWERCQLRGYMDKNHNQSSQELRGHGL